VPPRRDHTRVDMDPVQRPRVTIFGPDPLLSIVIETCGEADDVHIHAAGQGVWAARMVAELGAWPVLCCLVGGETGATLRPLLEALPGEDRIVPTAGASGSYVTDRRGPERLLLAMARRPPPHRHELDDLVAATCAAAWAVCRACHTNANCTTHIVTITSTGIVITASTEEDPRSGSAAVRRRRRRIRSRCPVIDSRPVIAC